MLLCALCSSYSKSRCLATDSLFFLKYYDGKMHASFCQLLSYPNDYYKTWMNLDASPSDRNLLAITNQLIDYRFTHSSNTKIIRLTYPKNQTIPDSNNNHVPTARRAPRLLLLGLPLRGARYPPTPSPPHSYTESVLRPVSKSHPDGLPPRRQLPRLPGLEPAS